MKIAVLGSGSSGNSIFIEAGGARILIDAGLTCKKIEERLNSIGVEPSTISAMFVTHEHTDHVQGIGVFMRKHGTPVHITKKSFESCREKLGKIDENKIIYLEGDVNIGRNLKISPFEVMHDAEMTVGFTVENGAKASIATDIGYTTNVVKEKFKNSDIVVIESNYDYDMLMNGSYPWALKERVKGRNGHLSNVEAAKFIKTVYWEGLRKVYLAHVSKDNNTYSLAQNTVIDFLRENDIDIDTEVAEQEKVSRVFTI